jgi:pimeloyl-ACP methyl ester carboxylesterase
MASIKAIDSIEVVRHLSTPGANPAPYGDCIRATVAIDVSDVAPPGGRQVVVDVFAPADGSRQLAQLWWMLPGGGMTRRYWDLNVSPALGCYSLAKFLVQRGHVAIAVDHLGVGESSRPADGFDLTPEVLADVNAYVFDRLRDGLATGVIEGLPAFPSLIPIGCGHSLGSSLTVYQQARHRSHRGICLLGYGGRGLASHVDPSLKGYIDDPEGLRQNLVAIARSQNVDPLPMRPRGSGAWLIAVDIPREVHREMVAARTNTLGVAVMSGVVPGNAEPELSTIDVPVFVGHGDRDIAPPLHDVARDFSASSDVTLFRLPNSGHNHNVSPLREQLWQRMLTWAETLAI